VKIKLNLFEGIVACTIFPNIGFIFTTLFFFISLIFKQKPIIYKGIAVSYVLCLFILLLSMAICYMVNNKSEKEFVLLNDRFVFLKEQFYTNQITSCTYYVCKWYTVPFAFLYKQQLAGLIEIKLNTGKTLKFKIFYKDYIKLKQRINNISIY
jgi:hypothetical protein